MNRLDRKVVLTSFVAFCMALALGRILFGVSSRQMQPIAAGNPQNTSQAQSLAVAVASPPKFDAPAQKSKPDAWDKFEAEQREGMTFKLEADGAVNKNRQLAHTVHTRYSDGMTTTFERMFKAQFDWKPQTRLIKRGEATVEELGAVNVRGELDRAGAENEFTFSNTYAGTDERFYIRRDGGIEHDIVLTAPLSNVDGDSALLYTGHVTLNSGLPTGLTLWDGDKQIKDHYVTSHEVLFKNQFGNVVFMLRRPYAFDANVATTNGRFDRHKQADSIRQNCQTPCQYVIDFDKDSKGVTLGVSTPGKWLADARRSYPVVIDPNLGAFGLADGQPPNYIGSVGTDSLIPAHSGGTRMKIEDNCKQVNQQNQSYGHIVLPFDFQYYGTIFPQGQFLFVHLDGFAGFDPPAPLYDPNPPDNPIDSPCNDLPNNPLPFGVPDFNDPPQGGMFDFMPYWADLKFADISGVNSQGQNQNQNQGSNNPNGNNDASGIYYFVDGVAPSRNLNIEWHKMSYVHSSDASQVISFNLILHECNSAITFIIGEQGDTDLGEATVGIQDPSGQFGIQYCYNAALNGQSNNSTIPPTGVIGNNGTATLVPLPNSNNNLNPPTTTNGNSNGLIQPGTSLNFEVSPISSIQVQNTALSGCAPFTACFNAVVQANTPQCEKVGSQDPTPPGFGFHWFFDDAPTSPNQGTQVGGSTGAEGFTPNICHVFARPGIFTVQLFIDDQLGHVFPYGGTLTVQVCEVPTVVLSATPQGGPAPLDVHFDARSPSDANLTSLKAFFQVDQLGSSNEPNTFLTVASIAGTPGPNTGTNPNFVDSVADYEFDNPGLYKTTCFYTAIDTQTGTSTEGVGTVFNFITNPTATLPNDLVVTKSEFAIDWTGKLSGLAPNNTGAPSNPNNDTLTVDGICNLQQHTLSDMAGVEVRVIANGVDPIFDGLLDGNGISTQGDSGNGQTGTLKLFPSGAFTCSVKGNLAAYLNLPLLNGDIANNGNSNLSAKNQTKQDAREVAVAYTVFFANDLAFLGPSVVSHAYTSRFLDKQVTNVASTATDTSVPANTGTGTNANLGAFAPALPAGGSGHGVYGLGKAFDYIGRIGTHNANSQGIVPANVPNKGVGAPVGVEQLISGGIMPTTVSFVVKGKDLYGAISGILAPVGGASFLPTPQSSVQIMLYSANNPPGLAFTQVLTFGQTPGFAAKGKSVQYKAPKNTIGGITALNWTNGAGSFYVNVAGIDNGLVGLDPNASMQTLVLDFQLTPDSGESVLNSAATAHGIARIPLVQATAKTGQSVLTRTTP